jgi:hypothetical protein
MKLKCYLFYFFILLFCKTQGQNSNFSISLGHNTAFRSSISNTTPASIYTYNKENNFGNDLISTPSFNLGLNYEYKVFKNVFLITGIHYSYTETELTFKDFYSTIDYGSLVEYGYLVNTIEIPLGIGFTIDINKLMSLKSNFALTYNNNTLSEIANHRILRIKNAPNDTVKLFYTLMDDFPSKNSLGFRFGISITPLKKYRNIEIGGYLNYQFSYSMIWNEQVEFENISQKTYEYHHAILKDKPDYLNFHIKYTFLKI